MKKLTAFLILCISLFSLFPEKVAGSDTGYFIVTAYYSPLPNQDSYIMGNYAAEIRMNGEGIAGASGKPVFSGMLAAPSNYSFGTKIYLEGLGIGEVADRGGAIVPAGQRGFQHDRIDVWMGYGNEGLRRAMYWGNRKVKGNIVAYGSKPTINLQNHPAPVWATAGLKKVSNIFNIGIGLHSSEADVKKLQELLQKNGLYNGQIDGNYNSIMGIIFDYQMNNGLVENQNTFGAGYWGNLTRSLFLKQYLNGTLEKISTGDVPVENSINKDQENKKDEQIPEVKEELKEKVDIFSKALTTEREFRALQEGLKAMGLYEGEIDGNYDSIKNTILQYQLGKKIIESESDRGAGVYGPKTRSTLKNDISNVVEEGKRKIEKKLEMKARKQELEAKFIELESSALDMAEQRVSEIDLLQEGDVSPAVRELQMIMKDLGYFEHNDTAIYGAKTKQSVFAYQKDRGLISHLDDIGAGMCGPVTKNSIRNDLKNSYLEGLLFEHDISNEELIEHGVLTF